MSLRACALLAVLLVTSHQTEARPSQRAGSLAFPPEQDAADSAYDMPEQRGSREMASIMYQMLQRAAQQQELQEQQHLQERLDDAEQESNQATPEEFPMLPEPLANTDKRGSYMSLCHFKICNMGRKRNLRRSQWGRY